MDFQERIDGDIKEAMKAKQPTRLGVLRMLKSALKNLAIERLSDESIRVRFSKTSLCEKLIPKLCKEACKNPEASMKIQSLYILSLLTVPST